MIAPHPTNEPLPLPVTILDLGYKPCHVSRNSSHIRITSLAAQEVRFRRGIKDATRRKRCFYQRLEYTYAGAAALAVSPMASAYFR